MKFSYHVLLADALFEGGRMAVGGISVAYLLFLGLPPSSVALLKSIQAITVIVAEIPTGIFSDRYGRSIALSCSAFFGLLGMCLYWLGAGLICIALGEFCLALSLCFWSGSFESWAIERQGIDGQKERVQSFFLLNSAINQFAIVLAASATAFLVAEDNYSSAYVAAMIVLGSLLVMLTPSHTRNQAHSSKNVSSLTEVVRNSFEILRTSQAVRSTIAIMIGLQILVQPLLHYWQPLLQETADFGGEQLSLSFIGFCLVTGLTNFFIRHRIQTRIFPMIIIWMGIQSILAFLDSIGPVLSVLIGSHIIYFYVRAKIASELAHSVDEEIRASVMSSAAFISRVGMLVSLALIGGFFQLQEVFDYDQKSRYSSLFAFYGFLGLFLLLGAQALRGRLPTRTKQLVVTAQGGEQI